MSSAASQTSLTIDPAGNPASAVGTVVQLCFATLPVPLGLLAIHHWFAIYEPDANRWVRWEVWQNAAAGGTSWSHVHRDLMRVDSPVGGGPARVEREWRGAAAERLRAVLECPGAYPERTRYRAWPGPNSNTYAAWALRQAGIEHEPDPRAVGWNHSTGWGVRRSSGRADLLVGCAIAGAGWSRGRLDLHLLGLTLGLARRPARLRTPFGSWPAPPSLPPRPG